MDICPNTGTCLTKTLTKTEAIVKRAPVGGCRGSVSVMERHCIVVGECVIR